MSLQEILDSLLTSSRTGPLITATRHFAAKPAILAPFPSSLDPRLLEALRTRGVEQLYSHQAKAFETVAKGENLVVVTPTASGKTLCYNLPVLQALGLYYEEELEENSGKQEVASTFKVA